MLSPDQILNAIEAQGYPCDGHLLALNSYENRVYQVGIGDGETLIAKFYRPERWSDKAILEEHGFSDELDRQEIPVVSPLRDHSGCSLFHQGPFRFALYPRRGGRAPDLEDPEQLEQLGRLVARIHNVGASQAFLSRPRLTIESFGIKSYQYLLEAGHIPPELQTPYRTLAESLLEQIQISFDRAGDVTRLRLHGDLHPGNLLWNDTGPHIVDLDDARMGPAIQDLWMFLSGDRLYASARLADLLEGYTQFRDFNPRELHLIEPLRTLRMMHYAAWIARRWKDPAFPRAFPHFGSANFWGEHILTLREQAAALDEPTLVWD